MIRNAPWRRFKVMSKFPSRMTPEERLEVEACLGHESHNLYSIEARTKSGEPAVVRLYPLTDHSDAYKKKERSNYEPFPTIFWLVSPDLKARVSLLEQAGWVKLLEERIKGNSEYSTEIAENHKQYARDRWDMLSEDDKAEVTRRGWVPNFRDVGIAGMRKWDRVKCLHTHYAHFLGTGSNLVGSWVQELLDQEDVKQQQQQTLGQQ